MATSQAKHGGSKKHGRDKVKCAAYRSAKTREHNKAKRIFHSNGVAEYKLYCTVNGIRQSLLGG